jgi:hypothetical protein
MFVQLGIPKVQSFKSGFLVLKQFWKNFTHESSTKQIMGLFPCFGDLHFCCLEVDHVLIFAHDFLCESMRFDNIGH